MSLNYRGERLFLGDKGDLAAIIESNEGHACYVYDLNNIETRYLKLKESLKGLPNLGIHYAIKANANPQVLQRLRGLGAQVDVVSQGEMERAFSQGYKPEHVIFSGVGKTVGEIDFSIDHGIKQINVESPQELVRIGERGKLKSKKVAVALRMNPEVSPATHPYITTGMSENKFGMDRSFIPQLIRILQEHSSHLQLVGLTMHIGSQLIDLQAMEEGIQKLLSIDREFRVLGFDLKRLDIGGGVGIHYQEMDEVADFKMIESYGALVVNALKDYPGEILIEPGRILVGRAGVLLCQVEYIKETPYKKFAIVNTGMHHLLRPALYQANHRILPLFVKPQSETKVYDFVGPICESSDFVGKNRSLQELFQGDYLAICDAGAYGYSLANNYNAHPLPKEFIIA